MRDKVVLFISLLILFFTPNLLFSQSDQVSKTVEVVREYDPNLPESYKINIMPGIDDTVRLLRNFTYKLKTAQPLTDSYLLTPIPPARVQTEQAEAHENMQGYLRLGLGVKFSSLLDAYVGGSTASDFSWVIYANHYGNYGDVKNSNKEKVPALNVRNDIGLTLNKAYRHHELEFNAGFAPRFVRYYGYDVDQFELDDYKDTDADSLRQHYLKTYASLDFRSKGTPDKWNYAVSAAVHDFRAKNSRSEDALLFGAYAERQMDDNIKYGVQADVDVFLRSKALAKYNFTHVSFKPYGHYNTDWLESSAKVDFVFENNEKFRFNVFPTLNATLLLLDGGFLPYAELTGESITNSFESLASENPYLTPFDTLDIQATHRQIAFVLGTKGQFSSYFSYNLWIDYSIFSNLGFYVNTPMAALGNYFSLVYDDGNVFSFNGQLTVKPAKPLSLNLTYHYQQYKMKEMEHPLHKPEHLLTLQGRYNLWNKLTFYADVNFRGDYYALNTFAFDYVKRAAGCDVSLGGEYRFFNRSSVFLQLNNLLNSQYQVFNGYNTYGFNVMLGYTHPF